MAKHAFLHKLNSSTLNHANVLRGCIRELTSRPRNQAEEEVLVELRDRLARLPARSEAANRKQLKGR